MATPTTAMSSRRGRGARERIERAAAKLFSRHGIHPTGVELVAQQASVSKRTLYQHFASKQDLVDNYLRAIDARGGSPMERRLVNPALPAPGPPLGGVAAP